jgi:hypothetical protein
VLSIAEALPRDRPARVSTVKSSERGVADDISVDMVQQLLR